MERALVATTLLVFAAACHTSAFTRAKSQDTPDAWRSYLLGHEDGADSDFARERLAELSWREAEAQESPRAYRHFIAEFPDSPHHDEATRRLAALRYRSAEESRAEDALESFLEDEPKGPLSVDARQKLADLEFEAARKAKGRRPVELYLARFPEGPHLEEARALADDRAYADAESRGPIGLTGYLEAEPNGRHRAEAQAQLRIVRVKAQIEEGQLDAAAVELRSLGESPEAASLGRELAAAVRVASLAAFDAIPGVSRQELQALQELAFELAPPDRAAVAQLADRLDALDPRDRWRAARALGATGSVWAIDPLLRVASRSSFWEVRWTAARGLLELLGSLPKEAREEEVGRRILALKPLAASSELADELGLLDEAAGDARGALQAFAQARRYQPEDLLALGESLRAARSAGEADGALALARELAAAAEAFAELRLREQGTPPLLVDRQLCGLVDFAQEAVTTLKELGAPGAPLLSAAEGQLAKLRGETVDAERRSALELPGFTGCDPVGARERSAAVERRVAAVEALAVRVQTGPKSELEAVRALLTQVASRDGSEAVRAAAARALAAQRP